MIGRQLVVVDVETSGLNPEIHEVVECSWWNLDTGERGTFIPSHMVSAVLARADIEALRINRYLDRIAGQPQDHRQDELRRLHAQFFSDWDEDSDPETGQIRHVLAGSNPAFDAAFLAKLFRQHEETDHDLTPWHHRLLDLSAYACGVLSLDPADMPGLRTICQILGTPEPDHTAAGDVEATGRALLELRRRAAIAGLAVPTSSTRTPETPISDNTNH